MAELMGKKKKPKPEPSAPFIMPTIQADPEPAPAPDEPQSVDQFIEQRYTNASDEDKRAIERAVKANIAATLDTPSSFRAFYEVVHDLPLPKHAYNWIKALYASLNGKHKDKEGVVIEAFRGSGKTTTLTITWTAYRIGKEPHKSNLLVQVGDDIAQDNTSKVADIIANNPGWKQVFPNVVPDMAMGWGAGGYEVKRTDISYPAWRQLNAQRKDPSFVGVGYKSREIIGKHPNGLLVIDDIHDENNTSSDRELDTTKRIVTSTILPTRVKGTLVVVVGTPWVDTDVLHYLKETGQFLSIKTPAITKTDDGETIYAWPEMLGAAEMRSAEKLSGRAEFARMYLLDLTALQNRVFKFQYFPADKIDSNWIHAAGVDYAGNMASWVNRTSKGDYFAMAYCAKLPGHGLVITGGELARPTQAEAEAIVKRPQEIYMNWRGAGVESDGRGMDFIQVLQRNPGIRIVPLSTGKKAKADRLEKQLGPWLENGTVWISNADTPFLNELRRELNDYPLCTYDDALDAVYYAVMMFPEALTIPDTRDGLPNVENRKRPWWNRNPFASLRRA